MEISSERIKKLIVEMEPEPLAQVVLRSNGYGRIMQIHDKSTYWKWDEEKIRSLDEAGINQLINCIVWS